MLAQLQKKIFLNGFFFYSYLTSRRKITKKRKDRRINENMSILSSWLEIVLISIRNVVVVAVVVVVSSRGSAPFLSSGGTIRVASYVPDANEYHHSTLFRVKNTHMLLGSSSYYRLVIYSFKMFSMLVEFPQLGVVLNSQFFFLFKNTHWETTIPISCVGTSPRHLDNFLFLF